MDLRDEQGGRPAVRIYKSKWFVRFAKKERIADAKLCEAIENAEKGLIDADYARADANGHLRPIEMAT